MRRGLSAIALFPFLLLLPAPRPVRAAQAVLTPEIVVDLRHVAEVAVAPVGGAIAYTLEVPRSADDPPGRPYAELWVVDAGGAEDRRFVGGRRRITRPEWSPDGEWLRFLVTDDDAEEAGTALFEIPLRGGEAHRVPGIEGSVEAHAVSPDGKRIAIVVEDPRGEQEKADREAGRDWKVFDETPRYRRLWLYEAAAQRARPWVGADLDVSRIAWAPDGGTVVFQAAGTPRVDDEYMFSRLYRVGPDGEPQLLTVTSGKLGPMAVSPDGRWLAYLGASTLDDPLAQSLFVAPMGGGPSRDLSTGYEGSGADLVWTEGRGLLLLAVEDASHALYRVDPRNGARERLAWPRLVVRDMAAAGGSVAVAAGAPEHPAEVFTFEAGKGPPVRRTRHNPALDGVGLARQEVVEWRGPDDLRVTGVLTYPRGFRPGVRYPLVLQIHGGPEGVSLDGWTTSYGYPVQVLAARGFMVLQPNYRGSRGRGVAFGKADHDDLGGKEFGDILAGVDHLVELGLVDPGRVGTGGWSYGGYLSAWAATRHSERFKASIVAAGLTNWISFAGTTDIPYEMSIVHWNSWWFDETELHWRRSPLAHLDRAHTPTLIVHGEKDRRVHPEQGLELYTALRIKGVPTQLVYYPREPHGLRERAHRLDFTRRAIAWFEAHLAPAGGPGRVE